MLIFLIRIFFALSIELVQLARDTNDAIIVVKMLNKENSRYRSYMGMFNNNPTKTTLSTPTKIMFLSQFLVLHLHLIVVCGRIQVRIVK